MVMASAPEIMKQHLNILDAAGEPQLEYDVIEIAWQVTLRG